MVLPRLPSAAIQPPTTRDHDTPDDRPHLIPDDIACQSQWPHARLPLPPLKLPTSNYYLSLRRIISPKHNNQPQHWYQFRLAGNTSLSPPIFSRFSQAPVAIGQVNTVISASEDSLKYMNLWKGTESDTWIRALSNKMGRLFQGICTHMPTGNNITRFILRLQVWAYHNVTYGRCVTTI